MGDLPKPLWRWWLFCFATAWYAHDSSPRALKLMGWCVLPEWLATPEEIAAAEEGD